MDMNGSDVEFAAQACRSHPVLGPATAFLKLLYDAVNDQSDGWAYWRKPGVASAKLQKFIKDHTGPSFRMNSTTQDATIEGFKKTIAPIRGMVTRLQNEGRSKFKFDVDWALQVVLTPEGPKPVVEVPRGVTQFKIWRISSNTNSFGHHQFYLTAKDGETWKVCRHQVGTGREPWKMYQVIDVAYTGGDYNWAVHGVEVPERLSPTAPPEVVTEIWEERVHKKKLK